MFRKPGVIGPNIWDGEWQAQSHVIGFISTMESDGRFIFSVGLQVMANTFRNFDLDPVLLNRCLEPDITDNKVFGGQYGLFLVDFSGTGLEERLQDDQANCCLHRPIWRHLVRG